MTYKITIEKTDLQQTIAGREWKQVGNAVAVPVVEWIGSRIYNIDTFGNPSATQ